MGSMSVVASCKWPPLFLQPCCSTSVFNPHFWKLAEGNCEEIGGRIFFLLQVMVDISRESALDLCPPLFLAVAA